MKRSTQKKNLARIIELAEQSRRNEQPNAMVDMVNGSDFYQYHLMQNNGMVDFDYSVAGDDWYFLSNAQLTDKGHEFIETFGDQDKYDDVKNLAKEQGERLTDLPLDEMMDLASEQLESELKL